MTIDNKLVNITYDPDYDVYIGRGSKWGNPFYIEKDSYGCEIGGSREDVIKSYEQWIRKQKYLIDSLHELKDKKLGCFCYPLPCHGDVLIKLLKEKYNEI